MSDDIKKLIQRLRATFFGERDFSLHDVRDAADALERLVAERDRLKAALETIAEGRDSGRHDGLPADVMHYIACEALEGRSTLLTIRGWERLGSEKVSTHGTPELDEDARKLEAMGQDPGATLEELLAPDTDLLREDAHERKRIESEYPWKE